MNCPYCVKPIDLTGGKPAFCPWCGRALKDEVDDELSIALQSADAEADTAKRHELLLMLREHYPQNIEVEKRLLFLGRLWERGGKPDFYRIPYWPLNALEKPGEFSKRQRKGMLDRFFSNPEFERVAALSEDKEAFRREYYRRMCADYSDLFIKKATSNNSILFFRRSEAGRLNHCIECLDSMLYNLHNSQYVPEDCRLPFRDALLDGFEDVFGRGTALELRRKYQKQQ